MMASKPHANPCQVKSWSRGDPKESWHAYLALTILTISEANHADLIIITVMVHPEACVYRHIITQTDCPHKYREP